MYFISFYFFFRQTGDDSILAFCLNSAKEGNIVHLITDDINLKNRALASKIIAYDSNELQNRLTKKCDFLGKDTNKNIVTTSRSLSIDKCSSSPRKIKKNSSVDVKDLKCSIVNNLGKVLHFALKETFGDLWLDIVIYKPPWSSTQVLKCFEKHWVAVFIDKLPAHILNLIKDIRVSLAKHLYCNARKKLDLMYRLFKKEPYKSLINRPSRSHGSVRVKSSKDTSSNIHSLRDVNTDLSDKPHSSNKNLHENLENIKQVLLKIGKLSCEK